MIDIPTHRISYIIKTINVLCLNDYHSNLLYCSKPMSKSKLMFFRYSNTILMIKNIHRWQTQLVNSYLI